MNFAFGAVFAGLVLLSIFTAIIFGWRGGRLGIDLQEDHLVLRGYFSDRIIPIPEMTGCHLGVDDDVIINASRGQHTVWGGAFRTVKAREDFLAELKSRIGRKFGES